MSSIHNQLQHIINTKTKPLGSLGFLEDIALQIGTIQQSIKPNITKPHIIVFAGDHGIATEGLVNVFPQAVTAQMVLNFVQGGAAINAFTKLNNIGLTVVDSGVNTEFDKNLHIIHAPINKGTKNYLIDDAMSVEEAQLAINKGKSIVNAVFENNGCNAIGFGEMGISNTSSAALIMHQIIEINIEECVGKGTGANEKQMEIKLKTLQQVGNFHNLGKQKLDSEEILSKVGGFEIAMMMGAYLQAFEHKMVILVDGFIATAALLLALQNEPNLIHNCIFAHSSDEKGHQQMLAYLKAKPLLQLGMRLGEGTGAAIAFPILQAACAFVNDMASFESAGVDEKV